MKYPSLMLFFSNQSYLQNETEAQAKIKIYQS